jgi:predicted nucleic acid-binding protein
LIAASEQPDPFITSAEVLQEILHRRVSRRWAIGRQVLDGFAELMEGRIEAVQGLDVRFASNSATHYSGLASRDLLHAAVMQRLGVTQIISSDRGFDAIDGVTRLDPLTVDTWLAALLEG